ncbi:putative DNA repair protein Rad1 [Aspergillus lucknowensis]|uniref:Repair protein Rad1/Rec1/Rad17-domain-containing protein n=1 Tax=Aspergillus lucknowensis TaxID=176173 RepID=A0ABR4L8J0_9EURO
MSLNQVWEAAAASPYTPLIAKDSQFSVGFTLLLLALILTILFGLNRSFLSIVSFGIPASLAFGFGAVYMICAVGNRQQFLIQLISTIYSGCILCVALIHLSPHRDRAVSSNTHQLFTLLHCVGFAQNVTVQITPDGIRFSVEEGRVVQGLAFLDKGLFTTYTFNSPAAPNSRGSMEDAESDGLSYPCFIVSLSALLETLKIFGVGDSPAANVSRAASVQPSASSAFTAPALLLNRSCTFQYLDHGSPLSITLAETGVKTICELTTYEPDEGELDIPFQRDGIIMKIIMRSAWLYDAITELGATDPGVLRLSASAKQEPYFTLSGFGGPFSESSVEFSIEQETQNSGTQSDTLRKVLTNDGTSRSRATRAKLAPTVTETFLVSPPSSMGPRIKQDYRFSFIQKASHAMAVANKVSIRGDRQGVLSLQFMIEFDQGGSVVTNNITRSVKDTRGSTVSFVDFRFVPLLDEDELEVDAMRDG